MPTDQDGSSSSTGFGFSILSRRRDQVHSMESAQESLGIDGELEALQKNVCDRFRDLAAAGPSELLSISWLRKLLEAFVRCQDEFRAVIRSSKDLLNKPPMEKYISDYFDRSVKALDVCNAIRDGIEQINQWHKLLEIVLYALDNQRSIGGGHFRRAKKALDDLAIGMLDEKDSNASLHAHRNRSFGRSNSPREQRALYQFRSLSWSVSRTWSAAKHLQAISSNLTAPRTNEILSSNGLSLAVFTMNNVLLFVMWVLVALIPCQDRGLQIHFNVTRQFFWAVPILSLHERILEESRKRDRKNTCGLLKEIHDIEKTCRNLNELADSVHFPLTEEKGAEVKLRLKEVKSICKALANDLDPFQRQVREVFHQLVRSRSEGLDLVARAKGYES